MERKIILTPREQEVLGCVAEGLSSKQIADKLLISEYTVDTHRKNMLRKMKARTLAQVVRSNMHQFLQPIQSN